MWRFGIDWIVDIMYNVNLIVCQIVPGSPSVKTTRLRIGAVLVALGVLWLFIRLDWDSTTCVD